MVQATASTIRSKGSLPPGIEYEDLISWGVEGLIKAKKNFKENSGSQFKTYAFYRIRGEILDKIRAEWQYRNPSDYESHRRELRKKIVEFAEEQLENMEGDPGTLDEKLNKLINNSAMAYLMTKTDINIVSEKEGTRNPEIEYVDKSQEELLEEINNLEPEEKEIIELFYFQDLKQIEIAKKLKYSKSKICRLHSHVLSKLKMRLERRQKLNQ